MLAPRRWPDWRAADRERSRRTRLAAAVYRSEKGGNTQAGLPVNEGRVLGRSGHPVLLAAFFGAEVHELPVDLPRKAGYGRNIRSTNGVFLQFAADWGGGRRSLGAILRERSGAKPLEDAAVERSHEPQDDERKNQPYKEKPNHGGGAEAGLPPPYSQLTSFSWWGWSWFPSWRSDSGTWCPRSNPGSSASPWRSGRRNRWAATRDTSGTPRRCRGPV